MKVRPYSKKKKQKEEGLIPTCRSYKRVDGYKLVGFPFFHDRVSKRECDGSAWVDWGKIDSLTQNTLGVSIERFPWMKWLGGFPAGTGEYELKDENDETSNCFLNPYWFELSHRALYIS